jgi:hypothetical protein
MSFRGDRRAVTVQVGAVLLLGFVVISLSLYQATVVPQQTKGTEFQHSQDVQTQLTTVRNAIVETGSTGATQPAAVELGTRYRPRAVFVNPPPASGTLRTVDTTDPSVSVVVTNGSAADTDSEVADYWSGTNRTYNTGGLVYRPSYSVYRGAPVTAYENTVLYNVFDGGQTLTRSDEQLVDGRRLNLLVLNGSLTRNGVEATTLDPRPLSVSSTRVTLRNDTANITLRLPTRLSPSAWSRLLDTEPYVSDHRVVTRAGSPNLLIVELYRGVTYELKVAKVGVGDSVDDDRPAYLTLPDDPPETVGLASNTTFRLAVRDRYDNPVSGVRVTANATRGTFAGGSDRTSRTSDADGVASFTYRAPLRPNTTDLRFNVSGGRPASKSVNVSLEIEAGGGGAGGGGSNINPNEPNGVVLAGADILTGNQCGTGGNRADCRVNVTLRNLDNDSSRNVSFARFNFYSVDNQPGTGGGNVRKAPKAVNLRNVTLDAANTGGRYRRIAPITIPANDTKTFTTEFLEDGDVADPTYFDVKQGDFFIVSFIFRDGETATYFVAPKT